MENACGVISRTTRRAGFTTTKDKIALCYWHLPRIYSDKHVAANCYMFITIDAGQMARRVMAVSLRDLSGKLL